MAALVVLALAVPAQAQAPSGSRVAKLQNSQVSAKVVDQGLPHGHAVLGAMHHKSSTKPMRHRRRSRFTGYRVEGRVSTFGYLTGDSEGTTADGGTTRRPCIAIRNDATLDHWFLVEVLGHRARLIQCDYGPGILSRAIDITGLGDEALGFSPSAFPTGAVGVARELRWDGSLSSSSARP
jgi:hypothetical protein